MTAQARERLSAPLSAGASHQRIWLKTVCQLRFWALHIHIFDCPVAGTTQIVDSTGLPVSKLLHMAVRGIPGTHRGYMGGPRSMTGFAADAIKFRIWCEAACL